MKSEDFLEVLSGYFDPDIQAYSRRVMERLAETPQGARVVNWAQANPSYFRNIMRLSSVGIQRLPLDGSLFSEILSQHISRLPGDALGIFGFSPNSTDYSAVYSQSIESTDDTKLLELAAAPDEFWDEVQSASEADRSAIVAGVTDWGGRLLAKVCAASSDAADYVLDEIDAMVPNKGKKSLFRRIFG